MNTENDKPALPARYAVPLLLLLLIAAFVTQGWDVFPGFYLRGALWLGMLLILFWTGMLKRFDYFLWFVLQVSVAYGLAPWAIALSEKWFPGHEALDMNRGVVQENGNLTNDIIFLFVVVALAVRLILSNVTKKIALDESSIDRNHGRTLFLGLAFLVVGMFFQGLNVLRLIPLESQQIVVLLGNLTLFGFAMLCCSLASMQRHKHPMRFVGAIVLVLGGIFYAVANFIAGGGQKGAIFNTVFILVLLFVTQSPRSARAAFLVLFATGILLVVSVPAMNVYKLTAGTARGNFADNVDLLRAENYVAQADFEVKNKGGLLDYWLEFGLQRVVLVSMPNTYVSEYWERGIDLENHLKIVMQSFLPRVLAPDKLSSDQYYNSIAIEAGIGGSEDYWTSRKPDLISESIILGSYPAVMSVAIGYSLVLILIHTLIARAHLRDDLKLAIIFTTLQTLGQIPYLGSLIPGVLFTFPFYFLVARFVCQPWLGRERQVLDHPVSFRVKTSSNAVNS